MSQTLTLSAAPSSALGLARKLSRLMVLFFAIAFLLNLSIALTAPLFAIFQKTHSGAGLGFGLGDRIIVSFAWLSRGQAIGAMIAMEIFAVPRAFAMYHVLKLFLGFAKGEIFTAKAIGHLRVAGWWLTVSFFASIAAIWLLSQWGGLVTAGDVAHWHFPGALIGLAITFRTCLFIGIPLLIAAYVMDEARRIAADHAEIV